MARLPYLERGGLPEEHQSLLDRDINLNRLLAHSPDGAKVFSRMGAGSGSRAGSIPGCASWPSCRWAG